MPASVDPTRTRAAAQAMVRALRDWRADNALAVAQHSIDLQSMDNPIARQRAMDYAADAFGGGNALGGMSAQAGKLAQQQMMAGLLRARAANTFTGQAPGAGVHVGMTQPKGTPTDKLFSNFADAPGANIDKFREAMLNRATGSPATYRMDDVATSTQPFGDNWVRTDAAKGGGTRVQVYDNTGETLASAKMKGGMIDSIASSQKGSGVGSDLLRYLDEQQLANIYEVPDRSPGFVRIQKQVIDALRNR